MVGGRGIDGERDDRSDLASSGQIPRDYTRAASPRYKINVALRVHRLY